MTETKRPTHFLLLFCYGPNYWTQLTVLSFLSAQCRLDVDIPQFRTIVVTDKKRYVKAYFGSWIELIEVDKTKLEEMTAGPNGHLQFKLGIMYDLLRSRGGNILTIESDVYFEQSPLVAFNALDKGKIALGKLADNAYDKAVLGMSDRHLPHLERWLNQLENEQVEWLDIPGEEIAHVEVEQVTHYFHFRGAMDERLPQIERFFGRYYYHEMGELYSMVNLWTPDKWHLDVSELPEELI
ncbi:hypothetical protein GC194_11780 [bacterium]|nr:hypothetical protein [bacterium]